MSPFRASSGFTERWEHFAFEVSDGVATIRLDRAEKLNALTFDMYEAFTQALLMTSRDHREFLEALQADRAPRWTGR